MSGRGALSIIAIMDSYVPRRPYARCNLLPSAPCGCGDSLGSGSAPSAHARQTGHRRRQVLQGPQARVLQKKDAHQHQRVKRAHITELRDGGASQRHHERHSTHTTRPAQSTTSVTTADTTHDTTPAWTHEEHTRLIRHTIHANHREINALVL